MADGDRESIRCVIGSRDFIQPEQESYHLLDLRLLRPAVTDDAALDLERGIFEYRNSRLRCCKKGDSPGVTEFQRRLNVGRVKHFLDGHYIDFPFREKFPQARVDLEKSFVERQGGLSANGAVDHGSVSGTIGVDDPVPGRFAPRVNPEYSH